MDKIKTKTLYDTATTARVLSAALGHQVDAADVRNLSRPGAALHDARSQGGTRGTFDPHRVWIVAHKMIRRRLAAEMGRISPRFLEYSHSRDCLQCEGIAVEWGGRVLCEKGHKYVESVGPGSPDGGETAIAVFEDGKLAEEKHIPAGGDS